MPETPAPGANTRWVEAPLRAAGPGIAMTAMAAGQTDHGERRRSQQDIRSAAWIARAGLAERRDVPDGAPRTRGRLVTERS